MGEKECLMKAKLASDIDMVSLTLKQAYDYSLQLKRGMSDKSL
ncbi:hypothetical protein ACIQ2D_13380 [Lysinibacillus sp. NPDC097287]